MKLTRIASILFTTAILTASQIQAQTVGIGTTKGGATALVSTGIASIVSEVAGFQMRPRPMGGTAQYVSVVNAGELEFGTANAMQTYMDMTGTGLADGKVSDNLRIVASLMTFRSAVFARADSGMTSVADLRGKRVPSEFSGSPLFKYLMEADLANAGLTWDDVIKVPQAGLRQSWDAFTKGNVDVGIAAIGSGIMNNLDSSVGGVVFLDLSTDDDAVARMAEIAPKVVIQEVLPAAPLTGVLAPTDVRTYKYLLWSNKDVSDEIVYSVVKAIYENEAKMLALSPLWRSHSSAGMATQFGEEMPYHPGAIKFYKEVGIWPGE